MENDGGLSVGTLIDLIVTVLEHPTTQSLIRVILRIGGEALKQHIATRNERRKKAPNMKTRLKRPVLLLIIWLRLALAMAVAIDRQIMLP